MRRNSMGLCFVLAPVFMGWLILLFAYASGWMDKGRAGIWFLASLLILLIFFSIGRGALSTDRIPRKVYEEVPSNQDLESMVGSMTADGRMRLDFPTKGAAWTITTYGDKTVALQRVDPASGKPLERWINFNPGWGPSPQKAAARFMLDQLSYLPDKKDLDEEVLDG